jgi:hypothetical protein
VTVLGLRVPFFLDGELECYGYEYPVFSFKVRNRINFFAKSHGKSACDGVVGTVKRLAAKASLQ